MPETSILIIGGGSSGLAAAGALKHHGLDSTILDRSGGTGSVWSERYERLHLHTARVLSHLPYYKIPASFPRYLSKDQFSTYLQEYAKHFNLDIQHGIDVTNIQKNDEKWLVTTQSGEEWLSKHLIIATGLSHTPYIPRWENVDRFQGMIIHSKEYRTGRDYTGKRVLVVGCGNSGSEICVDLVEKGAAFVANSIRTYPTIVQRDPLGIPIQIWGVALYALPRILKDGIVTVLSRVLLGDLRKYGMKKPEWQVFKDKRIPMIDVGYVNFLKNGKIHPRPDIAEFREPGVIYAENNQPENFDVVIAATGYRTGLQNLLGDFDVLAEDGSLIAPCGAPTKQPGLWFIGLENSPAGIIMASRIQARKMAQHIAALQEA